MWIKCICGESFKWDLGVLLSERGHEYASCGGDIDDIAEVWATECPYCGALGFHRERDGEVMWYRPANGKNNMLINGYSVEE